MAPLMTSDCVPHQVTLDRFEFDPKRDPKKCDKDLAMLRGVAEVFDRLEVFGLLPVMKSMGEALEQLLYSSNSLITHGGLPANHPLRELGEVRLPLDGRLAT
jgi:hypothetical protein